MSQYPFGYPFQGQASQQPQEQQQFPSQWQPYSAYPPTNGYEVLPTSSHQQPPQTQYPPSNPYYSSQPAYDFNANNIPGLGTPPTGPPFPVTVPFGGAWHQGQAAYGANPPVQFPAHGLPNANQSAPYTYPNYQDPAPASVQQPNTKTATRAERVRSNKKHGSASKGQGKGKGKPQQQKTQQPKPKQPKEQLKVTLKPQAKDVESQEEGEISDGYFDDLYDDAPNQSSVTVTKDPAAVKAKTSGLEEAAADGSDQEPNFYDTDMEDVSGANVSAAAVPVGTVSTAAQPAEEADRGRSRSYSPHLSPAEIQRDSSPFQESPQGPGAQVFSSTIGHVAKPKPSSVAPVDTGVQGTGSLGTNTNTADAPSHSFATVSEAQNEAKKAILRLLPHGVKYQTYIDEGLDDKVVRGLFTQLNLPTEPVPVAASEKSIPVLEKEKQEPTKGAHQTQPSQADDTAQKQEERKDRIARLLAEKKAKSSVGASDGGRPSAEPKSGMIAANEVAAVKPKLPTTRAEKDRLLQQKMEALRKKTASKQASTPVLTPDISSSTRPLPVSAGQTPVNPSPTVGTPTSTTVLRPAPVPKPPSNPATPQPSSSVAPSPVIASLLSALPPQQINQRKRPTAADFMDYPSSVKRPSLANRQASSLVISVSDDEEDEEDEDDEDVEMEVDSATEESPAPPQASALLLRRGPSIRDFPPLTNKSSARNLSSPQNGTSTSGFKVPQVDLQAKEEEIAKMRRQIEEMEARRANAKKGSVTPRTPSTGAATPIEQPIKLPATHTVSTINRDTTGTPSTPLQQNAAHVATLLGTAPTESIAKAAERQPMPNQRPRASSAQSPIPGKSAKALEKAERLRRMQEEMLRLQAEIDEDMDEEQQTSERAEVTLGSAGSPDSEPLLKSTNESSNDVEAVSQSQPMEFDGDESILQSSTLDNQQAANTRDAVSPESQLVAANESTNAGTQSSSASSSLGPSQPLDQPAAVDDPSTGSDDYEPPEANFAPPVDGETTSIDLLSEKGANDTQLREDADIQENSKVVPEPTSTAGDINFEQIEELSGEVQALDSLVHDTRLTPEKAYDESLQSRQTSYTPYESPLRCFRSYRFHPKYSADVAGGLKSLTYSSRIDPKKEMCPDEWEGNDCPRGEACMFQHFQNIIAPDSEIILELGSSDGLPDKQKFNQGLRDVVSTCQKSKMRDFRTIAQAIIDYRRKYLDDDSKVLPLEGTSL